MKIRIHILIGALFLCLQSYSQTISYSYDEAGNRIRKAVVTKSRMSNSESENAINYSLKVRRDNISILRKNTTGKLEVTICNIQGDVLISRKESRTIINISLSGYRPGTYIVYIAENGNSKTYKIHKK